ncbi:MAG: Oxidoreductase FAD-binding [Modestobacter sp.]|nr:Oxidoreductase FAD-binding [Modestobacter sp.]
MSNLLHDSVDVGDVLTLSLPFGDVVRDDSGRPLVYLRGPLPFMQGVRTALLDRGISPADIQYEVFGLDLWQADAD